MVFKCLECSSREDEREGKITQKEAKEKKEK